MKLMWAVLFFFAIGCRTDRAREVPVYEPDYETDSLFTDEDYTIPEAIEWNFQLLYGQYVHESNTKGFDAHLELMPEGNDLSFFLSVKQSACNGMAEGNIGMAVFSENEYAGFYDNDECRLEFYFNLKENTVRVQEVGFCRLRTSGCSFAGVYRKQR